MCMLLPQNLRNLSANSRKVAGGSKRPWFLAVGLHKPHPYWPLPLSARQQYMDLPLPKHRYAPIGMPPVAFVSCDYLQDAADVKAEVDAGGGILPNTTLSDTLSRKIRSGYAAGVTWMDRQAGRVLDELDALGHREDTVVLFTADHVRVRTAASRFFFPLIFFFWSIWFKKVEDISGVCFISYVECAQFLTYMCLCVCASVHLCDVMQQRVGGLVSMECGASTQYSKTKHASRCWYVCLG